VASNTYTASEQQLIQSLVDHYLQNRSLVRGFLGSLHAHIGECLVEDGQLFDLVHSVKFRMKDPEHLRDKLFRKIDDARLAGVPFGINKDNLLLKINDLGGYRILHLHTSQTERIHGALMEIIERAQFDLFEPPFANIWDEEARAHFARLGVRTEVNQRLYSSVHYVIKGRSKNAVTLEIQVRTLADEIWGEIDHKINYPRPHASRACREQIRVLARVASSCSRLVDSIMVAHEEWYLDEGLAIVDDARQVELPTGEAEGPHLV